MAARAYLKGHLDWAIVLTQWISQVATCLICFNINMSNKCAVVLDCNCNYLLLDGKIMANTWSFANSAPIAKVTLYTVKDLRIPKKVCNSVYYQSYYLLYLYS